MYDGVKSGRERASSLIKRSGYGMEGQHIPAKHPLEAEHRMAKAGGHPDEAADKALIKKMVGKARIHLKEGGTADGEMEQPRLDRRARGGKSGHGKGGPQVNIAVVPHAGPPAGPGMGAAPPTAMPPRPPMAPPPMAAPPPRPMPPPPGAMPPGGMPPGAPPGGMPMRPPGMMKDGGHARRQMGGPGMGAPGMPPPGNQQMTPQQMQAMQAMSQGNPPAGGTATSKKGGRAHRKDGGEMGDGGVGGSPRMTAGAGSGRGRLEKKEREHAERWGDGA